MKRGLLIPSIGAVGLLAIGVVATLGGAASAASSSSGEIVVCKFTKVNEPRLPANPTGTGKGRCSAFGSVVDSGTSKTKFTLLGNPPTGVRANSSFKGSRGTLTIKVSHAATTPVTFLPGPPPAPATAVSIGKFVVTKATGAFAGFKGKHGVSGAYGDNVHRTLTVSLIFQ